MQVFKFIFNFFAVTFLVSALSCGQDGSSSLEEWTPGQTDFTNQEPDSNLGQGPSYGTTEGAEQRGGASEGDFTAPTSNEKTSDGAPQGRDAEVEEADIYKVDDNRLFYLNTYRGFIIYDLQDPQSPRQLSRLPVYGYPIEMFVQKNTVYALISNALYLTQVKGKLQFKRHNTSQLLAIDISDLKNPKILQVVDIIGELREGVSRKVEDTVYVVSYNSRNYYYGWNYNYSTTQQKEQAWVYSFNVADPKNLRLIDKLQVFEGGNYYIQDSTGRSSMSRYFSDVTISATSNALMVAENWYVYGSVSGSKYNCGSYTSQQQAVVSIIDISDPLGTIKLHTKFDTYGALGDQFKQTYIYDQASGKGTYLGIFARQEWSSQNCQGGSFIQNTLESWDITDGKNPKRIGQLAFGKPDETVRGSVFDPERKVAFAITARAMDPLYALSFADPANLKIASAVDGLSGDMNVFRFIADKKFLVAIGQDSSETCTGFGDPTTGWSSNIAVSVIDVQDLNKIRLVQRKCVAVKDAAWTGSDLNWNRDQAHKMIGMHSDGEINAITVPVYYWKKVDDGKGWWWGNYETAVGLMTWDLTKYDPNKDELNQNVLENYGTIIHPQGQVKRTIIFTHKSAAQDRRMVLNLSDTHLSLVDIQDLNRPTLQSIVEVAPYQSQLFRFGQYMVEHVRLNGYNYGPYYRSSDNQEGSEFRIKKVGGKLEDTPAVATFKVGQVSQVVKYKDNLVLFRWVPQDSSQKTGDEGYYYGAWQIELTLYNLTDPTHPRRMGSLIVPQEMMPYYYYWCGDFGYWGGYWFYNQYNSNGWVITDKGLVFLTYRYQYNSSTVERKLVFINLSNPNALSLKEYTLTSSTSWDFFNLVTDPTDMNTFYLSYRTKVGETKIEGSTFYQYKYYAQRWTWNGSEWIGDYAINLPGRLTKTWTLNGRRAFLTYDYLYTKRVDTSNPTQVYWDYNFRLNLLRETRFGNAPVAELLDRYDFKRFYLKDLFVDDTRLFINARQNYYYGGVASSDSAEGTTSDSSSEPSWEELSDQLMIFDLSQFKMQRAYAEPTATYSMQLMGTYQGKLFINLAGDGMLVVDASDPAQPKGQQFMRTLGYTTNLEFADNTAYVAAGYFGIYQLDLRSSPNIAEVAE